jgi:hypothetical protein
MALQLQKAEEAYLTKVTGLLKVDVPKKKAVHYQ